MRSFLLMSVILLLSLSLAAQTVRIATYNIFFLDDGISAERKANLQAVLKDLDADIIAFQEINNPAAMENILGEQYRIAMIDDPGEVQEVALAARLPFRILSLQYVFTDKYYDFEFPRVRDLLQVVVEGHGYEFVFLVHHAKSRRGGRYQTGRQREGAAKLMVKYIQSELAGKNVILLGDFNDNPDDRSLNILEYGDFNAPAGPDSIEDTFLFNATEPLLEKDYCSYGYIEIYPDSVYRDSVLTVFNPAVPGARAENNKWRGVKEYNYYEDVKIKAILIDQILLSMNLKKYVSRVNVVNQGMAVRGEESKIRFNRGRLIYTHRGSLASDHVPVWVELELQGNP